MKIICFTLFLIFLFPISGKVYAQYPQTTAPPSQFPQDTTSYVDDDTTSSKPLHKDPRPKRAAIRSAIVPGWGQFYNGKKSYWKIPVIYVAGGTITYFLISNNNEYQSSKKQFQKDSTDQIARLNRDAFRSYRDWNVIMLLGLYVLNIVDANVTAHLQEFDVGESLSLNIKPYLCPSLNSQPVTGLSLTFRFKK